MQQSQGNGKFTFSRFVIPENVYYYEVSHHSYGDIGKLSLHFKVGDYTKVQITLPPYPSQKEAETAILNSGRDILPPGSHEQITWLMSERNEENRKFFYDLYLKLHREDDVEILQPKPTGQVDSDSLKVEQTSGLFTIELRIRENPARFATMVEVFNGRLFALHRGDGPIFVVHGDGLRIPNDTNFVSVHFSSKQTGLGWITAQSLPDNRTLLIVTAKNEDRPGLEPLWTILTDELIRQGFIDNNQILSTPAQPAEVHPKVPVKKSGGRPRDPDNQWAYEQVNVYNKDPRDIYPEWRIRKGGKSGLLVNPLDSFKKAIKPRIKGT
jgi:hypothetical protein